MSGRAMLRLAVTVHQVVHPLAAHCPLTTWGGHAIQGTACEDCHVDPVIVVGGGISGMSCARVIASAGLPVTVLDRGRGVGGRMAAPVLDGRPVDTGASYFTVSDDAFAAVVNDWEQRGLAHRWTDTFDVFDAGTPGERKRGNDRWAAGRGLRSLVEDLARGLEIDRHTVESVASTSEGGPPTVDGRPACAVVLAMPDPQARLKLR